MATVALLVGREPTDRYSVHRGYADAVWAVGATPLVLVPPVSLDGIHRYVDAALACDGICVTGGGDVDPGAYGEVRSSKLMDLDPLRDAAEIATVIAARRSGRPLLGICRGIQVMAAALGGSLHQDLPTAGFSDHWEEERQYAPVHPITATAGSQALKALGGATTVNSIHHQAVANPGPELTVTATAPDGVIEAVEAPGLLGVQWHPERLFATDERHLAPFHWLLSAGVPA